MPETMERFLEVNEIMKELLLVFRVLEIDVDRKTTVSPWHKFCIEDIPANYMLQIESKNCTRCLC